VRQELGGDADPASSRNRTCTPPKLRRGGLVGCSNVIESNPLNQHISSSSALSRLLIFVPLVFFGALDRDSTSYFFPIPPHHTTAPKLFPFTHGSHVWSSVSRVCLWSLPASPSCCCCLGGVPPIDIPHADCSARLAGIHVGTAHPEPSGDFGLIGLAVMGQNLILNAADHGFTVVAFNRTVSKVDRFLENEAKGRTDGVSSVRTRSNGVQASRLSVLTRSRSSSPSSRSPAA